MTDLAPRPDAAAVPDLLELTVGEPAAGGGFVASAPDGRVVFVRHALPGERVRAKVTATASRFLRADAVEILDPSPDRVVPPCPAAGPGRCGGCDYQHVALEAQRRLKGHLVEVQLARLAGLRRSVAVEALAEAPDGLGWRTRIRFAVDADGRLGLRRHRSHELERVERCPLGAPGVESVAAPARRWPGARHVEVVALRPADPEPTGAVAMVEVDAPRPLSPDRLPRLRSDVDLVVRGRVRKGRGYVATSAAGHRFQVSAGAFWQVHLGAPDALARAVLELLAPRPGERAADLYAGVGLFSVVLAEAVGPTGRVVAVERHRGAAADARVNTAAHDWVEVRAAPVRPATLATLGALDLVVLDPPREGAGTELMAALAGRDGLRAVAYVACDPASFARDARVLLDAGWSLASLRAFDCFPMTEHVELVALLQPPDALHAPRR